jgi:hypothetical protein
MVSTSEEKPTAAEPGIAQVFQSIEQSFAKTQLGAERWYILVTATLVGSTDPTLCDQLYLYLISKPEYSTPAQRQTLIRRIREALVKAVSIVGVCKPLEAIMTINVLERDEDKDHSETREGWQCDEANLDRGMEWMRKLYGQQTDSTMGVFADHQDFIWVSKNITYGLYLSDRQVLDDLDTQMVVLPGIMIQNLPKETHWHIRGTRRIGVSQKDVQVVWDSVQLIANHVGVRLNRVPTVESVEYDV